MQALQAQLRRQPHLFLSAVRHQRAPFVNLWVDFPAPGLSPEGPGSPGRVPLEYNKPSSGCGAGRAGQALLGHVAVAAPKPGTFRPERSSFLPSPSSSLLL